MPGVRVFITRPMPPPGPQMLADAGLTVDMIARDEAIPREELLARVPGCAGLVCLFGVTVDEAVLAAAGAQLKLVAAFAVGYDNIDVAACTSRRVRVTNTPGVLTNATADLTWSLILATARRVVEGDHLVRTGKWPGWSPTQLLGLELTGATLGVLGAGRIGTAVALRGVGFGMRVLYSQPRQNAELEQKTGARRVDLDELVAQADVLSLHVPMRPENRHLMDEARLRRMKPTAILINTARGAVIDEAALVRILAERRIAGAGLDVYEFEPRLSAGLAELPNVVLLPHLGSGTHATRGRMSRMVADNVLAVLSGRDPPNPVN